MTPAGGGVRAGGGRTVQVERAVSVERSGSADQLRIAVVAPVAQSVPPARSGSVESVTALLVQGLVDQGHDVTLFATGSSRTPAKLHATFARGYHEDPDLWPWEVCELMNLAAAVERADRFDVMHYQAEYAPISLAFSRLSRAPLVTTLHHAPSASEVALWSRYPDAAFIAVSRVQAELLRGLNVIGTVHHAVDTAVFTPREQPEGYLLFLGRFTEGKGVLQAIEIARRTDRRLMLAAAANGYYERTVAPLVDGERVVHVGELSLVDKAAMLAKADALLYPVQTGEPFGLVLAEAAACGTPVAALRLGAVAELVDDGVTGRAFATVDELIDGLVDVVALDRTRVRARAVERFGAARMVEEHVAAYRGLVAERRGLEQAAT
jgi:glycosyltransferase involved in cell wall biosynthesis